ncbi:hypothetical protein U1Q18_027182 [Sarracenia purpurea var. burkii]
MWARTSIVVCLEIDENLSKLHLRCSNGDVKLDRPLSLNSNPMSASSSFKSKPSVVSSGLRRSIEAKIPKSSSSPVAAA